MRFLTYGLNQCVALALVASCACVGGCMDDAALAQRAATKKLNDTLAAGQKAIAQTSALDPEANRTSAEMLRQIAASATPTAGSSASQKAAIALIASQMQIQAARLDAVLIEQLVKIQRNNADIVLLSASLSNQFTALANSIEQEVPPEARAVLQKDRETTAMTMKSLGAQAQKLKAVVDSAKSEIAEHESQALVLEKKSNELKQQSVAAGPIKGLTLILQSQKSISDSRKLQSQAAIIQLNNQASMQDQKLSAKIGDIYEMRLKRNKASMGAIADIESQRETSVKELKAVADAYRTAAIDSAKAMRADAEKINVVYDSAIESLEKAVSLAQQGTSLGGEAGKSAKNTVTSAQLALAGMTERRESAISLDIAAYNAAAKFDEGGSWSKDAAAAQTIRNASMTKSVEVFELVLNAIPQGGSDASTEKFRKSIELAKANFSGLKATSAAPMDATSAPTASDADSSTPIEEKNKSDDVPAPIEPPSDAAAPVENVAPVDAPVENVAPVDAPVENVTPVDAPVENVAPVDAPVEVPVEAAAPVEVPVEVAAPVEVPVEAAAPVQVPVEVAAPVEVPLEVPVEAAAPVEVPVEVPVEAPMVVKITSKSGANSKTNSKASANSQIKSPINPVATQSTTTSAETAPEKTKTTKKPAKTAINTTQTSAPTATKTTAQKAPQTDPTSDPTGAANDDPNTDPTSDPTGAANDEPNTDPTIAPLSDPLSDPTATP